MPWLNDTYSNWTATEKTSLVICNNKCPDQPAHPRSLISNFVVCFLRRIIPRLVSCEIISIFYLACLAEGAGLRLAFVGNPEDRFSRIVACVACSTALGQIFQVQQIMILNTYIMRRLFIRYINGNHIIWLRSTSSNTQVIRNFMYGPQSRGTAGALIFWLHVSGMTLY